MLIQAIYGIVFEYVCALLEFYFAFLQAKVFLRFMSIIQFHVWLIIATAY